MILVIMVAAALLVNAGSVFIIHHFNSKSIILPLAIITCISITGLLSVSTIAGLAILFLNILFTVAYCGMNHIKNLHLMLRFFL